jgi:hypothetical protein
MTEFQYRLLGETSWGIAIDVKADIFEFQDKNKCTSDNVIDQLWVDFKKTPYLSDYQRKLIIGGINWGFPKLSFTKDQVIILEELIINPTDFQDEGLFYAMSGWINKHFKMKIPEYSFSFDKNKNKYIFPLLNSKE